MSAVPAASYLADFGCRAVVDAHLAPGSDADRAAASAAEVGARIEAAHASGFEDGKAALRAELERKLEAQRVANDARLASERQAWVSAEAGKLAERLTVGLTELEGRIADTLARILQPFLGAELRRRAIGELRAELEALLRKHPGIECIVSGPEDLLDELRRHLAGKTLTVTYRIAEGVDLRVEAGQTVLETRLGVWLARMQEALQ
jgi:hypothetical protein